MMTAAVDLYLIWLDAWLRPWWLQGPDLQMPEPCQIIKFPSVHRRSS